MSASPKTYECKKCGEEKDSRGEIRDHVKNCQPNWSTGKGLSHPQGREPLSTRYTAKEVEA